MKPIDLNDAFMEYFHEQEGYALRSERFSDDAQMQDSDRRERLLVMWMEACFIAGARTMAQDTLDTLGDYATATSGLPQETMTPSERFDRVHQELMVYFAKVLP